MSKKSKMVDKNSLRKWVEQKNKAIGKPTNPHHYPSNPIEDLRGNSRNQFCN